VTTYSNNHKLAQLAKLNLVLAAEHFENNLTERMRWWWETYCI